MSGPTPSHHLFSDFCRKLFAAATEGQHYAPAWAALAVLLKASSVQLLRDVPLRPGFDVEGARVHALDAAAYPVLPRAFPITLADQGLLGVARVHAGAFDAVVVLRQYEAFTDAERSWMELLLAHIGAALELADQLARPLPTAASAVQLARLFPTPCVLTDEHGRCVERNQAFDRMLEAMPGGIRNGQVVFDEPQLQDAWQQALLRGGLTAATQSIDATTGTGDRWNIHLVPFYCVSSAVLGVPEHLMFALFDKSVATSPRSRPVPTLRPLTKAELEVLACLLHGHTAKMIARARGASVNTVRNQIANVLGKTGHRTQKELMAACANPVESGRPNSGPTR